jgi:O-antigen/teichoic acid export membrane protein
MSLVKKLAGDTVLYGMSSIVGRLLNWLLVIVHTRVFVQPELLTENAQLYTYVIPLNILFTFGMETAFFRFGSEKENQSEYFNLILSFIIVLSGVLTLGLILGATPLVNAMHFHGKERLVIMLAIVIAIDAICAIAFVKLRAQNKAKRFVGIKITNIAINIFLNAFYLIFCNNILKDKFLPNLKPFAAFVYNANIGPDYIIWANYVASMITLGLLWKEFVGFKFTINWPKMKEVLVYAYPLMIMGLAGAINLTADRLMFRELLPLGFYPDFPKPDQAFSIYSQVYKLSIFMTLVVQAYRYAADPLFFSKMGDKNSPNLIALSTKWFTIACIILWVGVSLNLDWIGLLIGENYRSGLYIVPILLLANLFIGVYGNTSIWFKLVDKTKFGTYLTIAAMILTIILNIVLIPRLGYLGCAITFTISSFFMVVACYILGQKHYPIPYELKEISAYLVGAGLIILANTQIHISNFWISIPYHMLLTFLFIGVVYWYEFRVKENPDLLKKAL